MGGGVQLWGYDGTNWKRVLTSATGRILVDNRHDDITQEPVLAVGLVNAGLTYLYWVTVVPSAAGSLVTITDSLVGGAAVAWGYRKTAFDSDHITFTPALKLTTGLYVETLTNITAIVVAYDII